MIDIAPREVEKTGDDTPASSIAVYVWRMSGWRQVGLCVGAIGVSLLNLAPIELQRRLIDDAITKKDMALLLTLGGVYAAVLVAHRLARFALGAAQGWLGESAVRYTRNHLLGLWRARDAGERSKPGAAVSVLGSEIDKLGGYVGVAPSQASADAAMLLGVIGYMMYVAPMVAGLSIALLLPQLLVAPLMQRRLNNLIEARLGMMRAFGEAVTKEGAGRDAALIAVIYRNRLRFYIVKHLMKAILNLLNGLAPLSVLLFGGWMVVQGETTIGVLVAFLSGFQRLAEPIRSLITFYRETAQARVQHNMIARWM